MSSIILCGFMGCGKTSVGKRAAGLMDRIFCDLDHYIEEKAGMTVSEIFERQGEAAFRKMETEAAAEVSGMDGMIIATGGGTVLAPRNVDIFHENSGIIVFLEVPVPVLTERLKNDTQRPLLQKPDREKVIAELVEKRYPLYRAAADYTVDGSPSPWIVAKHIALLNL